MFLMISIDYASDQDFEWRKLQFKYTFICLSRKCNDIAGSRLKGTVNHQYACTCKTETVLQLCSIIVISL